MGACTLNGRDFSPDLPARTEGRYNPATAMAAAALASTRPDCKVILCF